MSYYQNYNPDVPMSAPLYVAPSGILTPVLPNVPATVPNLSQYGIYIDQVKLAEQQANAAKVAIANSPVPVINNIVQIAASISDQKAVAVGDPNNVSAANAADVMKNHIINLAATLKEEAINNPDVPELQVQAKLAESIVADAVVVSNETAAIIQLKVQNDKENVVLTLEKIAAEKPTPENNTNLAIAKGQYDEVLEVSADVSQALDESKAVASEITAKIESDIAAEKLEKPILTDSKPIKKLGFLDQIVNYIYNNLYKN